MMAIDLSDLATAIGKLIIRFRLRRATAATWAAGGEVLLDAEMGYEKDTKKIKIGDGVTPWPLLDYWTNSAGELDSSNAGAGISIGEALVGGTPGSGGNPTDDADFASVGVLLPFDGVDMATTTQDYGPNGLRVNAIPNAVGVTAHISTTDSKWGGSSSYTNTSLPGWSVEDDPSLHFEDSDFTIECWLKVDGGPGFFSEQTILAKGNIDAGGTIHGWYLNSIGAGSMYLWLEMADGGFLVCAPQGIPVAGVWTSNWTSGWNHVAFVRHAGVLRPYINGVEYATSGTAMVPHYGVAIGTASVMTTTDPLYVAHPTYAEYIAWWGYIDDVRVSKVARYTADFTPPTAAFPKYGTPVVKGSPKILITNIGIVSITAGSGIAIDDSDPHNIVIRATGGGGGGGGGGNVSPDDHPASPSAMDDEFEGTSFDTTLWTWEQQNSATASLYAGNLILTGQLTASNVINAIEQTLGAGDHTFVIKAGAAVALGGNFAGPVYLRESSTGDVLTAGVFNNAGNTQLVVANGSISSGYTAVPASVTIGLAGLAQSYWKIEISGTNIIISWSGDGVVWQSFGIYAMATYFSSRPDKIGLNVRSSNSTTPAYLSVDYFRRTA